MFQALKQHLLLANDIIAEEAIQDAEAYAVAEASYHYLESYFGEPSDKHIPYKLIRGGTSSCTLNSGAYYIILASDCKSSNQYHVVISHEMYHRITNSRRGLHQKALIDEMLGFLSSKWFLESHDREDYVQFLTNWYLEPQGEINISRAFRVKRGRLFSMIVWNRNYRRLFYKYAVHIAISIEHFLSREEICRMVHESSFDQWLSTLDASVVNEVRLLFGQK